MANNIVTAAQNFSATGSTSGLVSDLIGPDVQKLAQGQITNSQTYIDPSILRQKITEATSGETSPAFREFLQGNQNKAQAFSALFQDSAAQARINTFQNSNSASAATGRFTEVTRQPFVITCQKWIDESRAALPGDQAGPPTRKVAEASSKYIFCNVNPSQIQWSFPLRAVDQRTLGGYVQHVWRSPKRGNTFFDEPTVSFTFQSGNILPVKMIKSIKQNANNVPGSPADLWKIETNTSPIVPAGVDNFYKFFELFDQPRIINDANGNRRANLIYIFYTSRVFPQLTMTGLWTPEGIEFSEDATNPNEVNWTAKLTVYSSFPAFNNPQQMARTFVAAGFGQIAGHGTFNSTSVSNSQIVSTNTGDSTNLSPNTNTSVA